MRGYGLPRNHFVEFPDCVDINLYGLNIGRRHNAAAKAASRRIWKKKARQAAKVAIKEEILLEEEK